MDVLVFDTETTGLPDWKQPSESEQQPHLVEIAAILFNDDGTEIERFSTIVKPDGWTIPEEVSAIHGITTDRATAEGIPEAEAIAKFLALHRRAGLRVAHNESFDARILRIGIKRFGDGREDWTSMTQDDKDAIADAFKAAPSFCTMREAKPVMKLPATPAMVRTGKGHWHKPPSMQEAHQHFVGESFEGAHTALADAQACARVYFALKWSSASAVLGAEL